MEPPCSRLAGQRVDRSVESGAWAHYRSGLGWIRRVVAADVGRLALDGVELVDDFLLAVRQALRERREVGLQLRVLGLRGERLRPVQGEVVMAAAVIQLARLGRGILAVIEQRARR